MPGRRGRERARGADLLMATWDAIAGEHRRDSIAIAICVISAVLAVVAIVLGSHHVPLAIGSVAATWGITADWLGRRFWLLRKTPGQIYRHARQGSLRASPLARAISLGSLLLFIAAIVCFFR